MPAGMVMGVLEHPGTDRVRQSKPTVFYGGSSSGGLGGCSFAGGNHSERERPKSNVSKLPKAPGVLLQGWDRGQIQAGTCCWISPGLRL